jgi:integrase
MKQFRLWATGVENYHRTPEEQVNCERPTQLDVALYVQYLVQVKQGSRAVVGGALAAITDHIRYERTPEYDPCNSALVQQTRDVLLPTARAAIQKKELVWKDLRRILDTIESAAEVDEWLRRRDALMFLLAYSALLRGSEVVRMKAGHAQITRKGEEDDRGTGGADAPGPELPKETGRTRGRARKRKRGEGEEWSEEGTTSAPRILRVYVDPRSKNDAERTGHTRLFEERATNEDGSCVVRRTEEWLGMRYTRTGLSAGSAASSGPDRDNEPMFPTRTGRPMHEDTPRGRLNVWMTRAGFKGVDAYGFHSLRAGGATDASRAGVSERDIQRHGNWKSNIVQLYMRANEDDRLNVSRALGAPTGSESKEQ